MFQEKLKTVPHLPGSYQMYNQQGVIIYVGKAKDLKKRLTSYFNGRVKGKTLMLVNDIAYFEYIITSSELEAFILEINLIKKFNPKYNILLKDDKSYPYIEYRSNPYPQLAIVRYLKLTKQADRKLFGPYPNTYAAKRIVNLLNRLYPLKKCINTPNKVCLYYHIGECLGYCAKRIDQEQLKQMEKEIMAFLKDDERLIKQKIFEKININSENMNYEAALELKNELEYMEIVLSKQKVESFDLVNRDVINYYLDEANNYLTIEILFIREGKLLGHHAKVWRYNNDYQETLELYIANFYTKHEVPLEIIVPDNLNQELLASLLKAKVLHVQKGYKKKLLTLALVNAQEHYQSMEQELIKKENRLIKAHEELAKILNIAYLQRIELFDNSHLFGSFYVSGMVVFIDGEAYKTGYRKYKIAPDVNDDYHAMQEVIYRRYQKALMEQELLPQLIVVDGGVAQINAACEVLASLNINIMVIGLAKDDHHKTAQLLNSQGQRIDSLPNNVLQYLTRMQDEVHRYTINYHRQIRSKGSLSSALDIIPGLGPKRKKALLKKFVNLDNMRQASINDLAAVVPLNVAKIIKEKL